MSKTETKTHTHLAKDGLYYRDYQEMVAANVRVNNERLAQLGLGESPLQKLKAAKKKNNKKKRKPPSITTTGELRRSNRMRQVTPEYSLLPENYVDSHVRKRIKAGSRSNAERQLELHELEALKNLPDWLDDFEEFLLTVPHGGNNKVVSPDNARSVMKQTRRMVAGMGIEYHHWIEGVIWMKGVKIDLGMDFDELHQDATAFEAEHGRDLGNGWLMRHAIRKLQCYQEYVANKGKSTKENA